MRYTTRTEAIQAEIIDPIQSSEAVTDAAAEYDIEAIADEVIGSYGQGFVAQVGPDKFWTIVANHASATHKNIIVPLVGEDDNAFAILGRVSKALRRGGATSEELDEFIDEAKSGDYDHLLATVQRWVDTDGEDD